MYTVVLLYIVFVFDFVSGVNDGVLVCIVGVIGVDDGVGAVVDGVDVDDVGGDGVLCCVIVGVDGGGVIIDRVVC